MKEVTAYVHTHWDREWYREFEEFRLRLIEVFDEVLEMLETEELEQFYFDGQTAALEDYLEIKSEKLPLIKKFIKGKKLRIGPFYCSSDSFLVSGESLYKNMEFGLKTSRELGETEFIGYLSDTFGHSKAVNYILKSFNIDKACMWRGLGDCSADLDWDGIKVTYLIQGYFQDFLNSNLPFEKKAEFLKNYIDKIALKSSDNILLPIGADHLAAAKNLKEQIKRLNKLYKDYNIKLSSPFEYFNAIKKREKADGEFLNNSKNFILQGVYSSRLYIKRMNAYSQHMISKIAQPLQALGHFYLGTKDKQAEINYAYKMLIKNHAHDSMYGCGIDKVYDEMTTRFEKVNSVLNGVVKRTLRDIEGENLGIINLSDNIYSGKVRIITEKKLPKFLNAVKVSSFKGFTDKKLYNINDIPVTEDYTKINEYIIDVKNIPPYSLTLLTERDINKDIKLKCSKNSLENEYIKLEIKNGRAVLIDKKTNNTFEDFIKITDRADIGDSYNFGALKGDKPIEAHLKSYKLKEENHQRGILDIEYRIEIPASSSNKGRTEKKYTHKLNLEAILYNNSEFIEFKVNWVNKSRNHILQIGFQLKDNINKTLNEDLYGCILREFNPKYDVYKDIPAPRGVEYKLNTSPMQRFVNVQGVLFMTKGLTEYEVNKNTLLITLLRASGVISNPKNTTRGTPAGPPVETEKLQCLGENSAEFAVSFTDDENKAFKLADEYYYTVIPVFTNLKNRVFIENSNKNIKITSVELENDDLKLRLFNNSCKTENTTVNSISYQLKPKEIKNILISH